MNELKAFCDWAADNGLNLRREESKEREFFYELAEVAWQAWLARSQFPTSEP